MAGIRIGGVLFIPACSPPFSAYQGPVANIDQDPQVFRACAPSTSDEAVVITDFQGFVDADQTTNPQLSPDGTMILFEVLSPTTGYDEIWVVSSQPGSTAVPLLQDASNYYRYPFWGPDSDTFCCIHGDGGTFNGSIEVTTVTDPTTVDVIITEDGTSSPQRPQFSPDGTKIAYWWDTITGTGLELKVCDPDGSNDTSIYSDGSASYRFQGPQFGWSHDSSLIAFDGGLSGTTPIYVIEPDGTNQVQINSAGVAADVGRISGMCFPPDDSYVVIAANLGSGYNEAIRCELDGTNTTSLNGAVGAGGSAAVMGLMLVFENRLWFVENSDGISRMDLDGSNYVNVLNCGSQDYVLDFTGGDGFYFN